MQSLKEVIQTLQERYQHFQQPVPEPIPNLPDYIQTEDVLVVIKTGRVYKIENLKDKQCYIVSKINGVILCSCDNGKEEKACQHKRAVLEEYRKFKRLRADESAKRRIGANMSAYIYRLNQIVKDFERRNDVRNSSYNYYRGKLSGLKLVLRLVIES